MLALYIILAILAAPVALQLAWIAWILLCNLLPRRRPKAGRQQNRFRLEKGGLVFSGMSPDGLLPEIVERPDHPWFVGVQFHPELKSKPFDPHPLFAGFIEAALEQSRLV